MKMSLKISSLALAAIVATSCGSGKLAAHDKHFAGGVVSSASSLALHYTGVFTITFEGGYSASVTLRRGGLVHAKAHDTFEGLVVGGTCGIDYQTDAVEPFQFTVTNITKGFSFQPVLPFTVRGLRPDGATGILPINVQAEIQPSGGQAQCINWQDPNNPPSLNAPNIAPGASATIIGDFIVSGAFTPADPTGSGFTTAVKQVFISFLSATAKSGMIEGDAIPSDINTFYNNAFLPFDPAFDSPCINNGGRNCPPPPAVWPFPPSNPG